MTSLAVAVAAALGGLARYWIGVGFGRAAFPWPTLTINLLGCFLLGLVLGASPHWNATLTTACAVGFLGAFTTFSTFAFETQVLLQAGRPAAALAYVGASVGVGVVLAAAGYAIAQGGPLG